MLLVAAPFALAADVPPPSAQDLGLMVGSPPPAEKQVTYRNFMLPPFNRWGLQHVREVVPTRRVAAPGAAAELPRRPVDLAGIEVDLGGGRRVTVGDWLESAYTDGIMVLHDGEVVFERYFNGQTPATQHLMWSVTKSFTSTMVLALIEEGRIEADAPVATYLPELDGSAFGDATVQQVLDMTTSVRYDEDYYNPDADFDDYLLALEPGGEGIHGNLQGVIGHSAKFRHGEAFHYVTLNTEVLGWIVRRVTGETLSGVMDRMIWSRLGAEHDAWYWLDSFGAEAAGVGLAITLPDAARFGQMILQDGHFNGVQVISRDIAQRIKTKRNADIFNRYNQDPWYGEIADSYHDQWWGYAGVDAVSALGIHGQFIYINSDAGVVIAKQSSDPDAESDRVDSETPLIMHAIAAFLAASR